MSSRKKYPDQGAAGGGNKESNVLPNEGSLIDKKNQETTIMLVARPTFEPRLRPSTLFLKAFEQGYKCSLGMVTNECFP